MSENYFPFSEIKYIGVFGSFLWNPSTANDIDISLFTDDGELNNIISPSHNLKLRQYLEQQFGQIPEQIDFIGRRDSLTLKPYNLNKLPTNDIWLKGQYLTGIFLPNPDFLEKHFEATYGLNKDYLLWLEFVEYITNFEYRGVRLEKTTQNQQLMLIATKKLIKSRPELTQLIKKYDSKPEEVLDLSDRIKKSN